MFENSYMTYGAILVLLAVCAAASQRFGLLTIASATIVGLVLIIVGIHISPTMRLARAKPFPPADSRNEIQFTDHTISKKVPHR